MNSVLTNDSSRKNYSQEKQLNPQKTNNSGYSHNHGSPLTHRDKKIVSLTNSISNRFNRGDKSSNRTFLEEKRSASIKRCSPYGSEEKKSYGVVDRLEAKRKPDFGKIKHNLTSTFLKKNYLGNCAPGSGEKDSMRLMPQFTIRESSRNSGKSIRSAENSTLKNRIAYNASVAIERIKSKSRRDGSLLESERKIQNGPTNNNNN